MELLRREGFVVLFLVEEVDESGVVVWSLRGSFGEKELRDGFFVGDVFVPVTNQRGFCGEWVCCCVFGIFLCLYSQIFGVFILVEPEIF